MSTPTQSALPHGTSHGAAGPRSLPGPRDERGRRRATRDLHDSMIGGVAAGLARHLGLPVLWVRLAFVVSTALSGLGLVLYAVFWAALPAESKFAPDAPGLEGATRDGRRPAQARRLVDMGPVIVLGVLGVAALFTVQAIFGTRVVFWPLIIAAVGLALLWRQADEAQRERWFDPHGRVNPLRIVFGSAGWPAVARIGAGLLLLVGAFALAGLNGGTLRGLDGAYGIALVVAIAIVGIGVVVGPWVWRLAIELSDERAERVRTQERADVAAHLHDSVLQTLALIQKNAADSATVARLARSQERELRAWLYSSESQDDSTVGSALRAAAAEVEDAHGIAVDVVTVGEADLTEQLRPIVAATRESITNAAKHAGVDRVDVYAEITSGAVDVFVRDRGAGFDLDGVPEDRYGVRHSIIGRMERHGGSGEIRSTAGEGTEVRLHLPREQEESDD